MNAPTFEGLARMIRTGRRQHYYAPLLEHLETRALLATGITPTATIRGDAYVPEGAPYALALSSSSTSITQWTIDWGDGSVETIPGNQSSVTHVYQAAAARTIHASATDAAGTYSAQAYVNGALPTATQLLSSSGGSVSRPITERGTFDGIAYW